MSLGEKKENIRKMKKRETCMISYGNEIICIDPSLPVFHLLGKKYSIIILAFVGGDEDGKSFNEILMGIPYSSSNIISARLKELEENKYITRNEYNGKVLYKLTEKGKIIRESIIPFMRLIDKEASFFSIIPSQIFHYICFSIAVFL